MDLEELVRQAFRNLALGKKPQERERLLRLLPEFLAQLELERFAKEQLYRYGSLD